MPQSSPFSNSDTLFDNLNANNIQQTATQIVYAFCTIVSMPVEYALRPLFGSQYFAPPLAFMSALMMVLLPVFFGVTQSLVHLLPFMPYGAPPVGIGLGTLAKWFFIGSMIHGIRIWRRMIHMESEENSRFEGPALPLFFLFPQATFWMIRTVWEPVFVFALASALGMMNILQGTATYYLQFAALCLAMKNFVSWHSCWKYFRDILDMRDASRVVAQMLDNTATERDTERIHMAGFPKDVPPEMKRSAMTHIARAISPDSEARREQ